MDKFVLSKLSKEEIDSYRNWFDARDNLCHNNDKDCHFCHKNGKYCSPDKALRLAKMSKHPDAKWLCSIIPDDVYNKNIELNDLANIFEAHFPDRRALCLWGCMFRDRNIIKQSAKLGYYYAQCHIPDYPVINSFKALAEHYEPNMFYKLAEYHRFLPLEDDSDLDAACEMIKNCYKLAAQLGHTFSMHDYGSILNEDDPQRYYWLGKAAQNNFGRTEFLEQAKNQLRNYRDSELGYAEFNNINQIIFQIGFAVKGYINLDGPCVEVFETPSLNHDGMLEMLALYDKWHQAAKDACNYWMLISKRLPIHKDLRKVIANLVWTRRVDADYKILPNLQK